MLDKQKNIDAVTISTPDHVHAPAAIYAMLRGKHVYIQKPMTHNISEARILLKWRENKKLLLKWETKGDLTLFLIWFRTGLIKVNWDLYQKLKFGQIDLFGHLEFLCLNLIFQKTQTALNWDLWLGPAKSKPYTPNMHPF